jgi:hypothetical protein
MVHALKIAHSLLKPEGLLINIHNLPAPHIIGVCTAGSVIKAGWLTDCTDFKSERFAFDALARVISEGIFLLEDERDFSYHIHADDLHELQEWLAEWWEAAVLPEKTIQRVEDLIRHTGQATSVVIKVPARMIRLRSV